MAILSLAGVCKHYGSRAVLQDATAALNPGEKVGVVGRNGAGKTTLLRLIAGREDADRGSVGLAGWARVGYLTQDPEFEEGNTLWEEALRAFREIEELEARIRALEKEMGRPEVCGDDAALARMMEHYSRLTARYELRGGYDYRARAKSTLFGLGFSEADLRLPAAKLSGGQKVRAGLAKLLMEEPDLLLLDEPTNHLDIASAEWLEEYLKSVKGAILIVSHDRFFLDSVVGKIFEVEEGRLSVYPGNYSYYRRNKDELLQRQSEEYRRQQEEVARIKAWIQKYQAGTRSTQAKSRQKMLARMDLVAKPKLRGKEMALEFRTTRETGEEVLRLANLSKSFGSRRLFEGLSGTIDRGERVAVFGRNGAGKTTLLKILFGLEEPSEGAFQWGEGVEAGYFSQDLDDLTESNTVLDEILDCSDLLIPEARTLLGRFLFSGEDVSKPVSALSGGERNRVSLAKLVISGANVLLLDEPTNHLDLESKGALERALADFLGTIIVVSHDRYFLDQVATSVLEIDDGRATKFEGNYSAYRALKAARAGEVGIRAGEAGPRAGVAGARATGVGTRAEAEKPGRDAQKMVREAERRAQELVRRLEGEIEVLEARRRALEGDLASPEAYREGNAARELVAEYDRVRQEIELKYAEWEEACGALGS